MEQVVVLGNDPLLTHIEMEASMHAATTLPLGARLTQEEVRHFRDYDLVQAIICTDHIVYQRPLTDTEIHNFWLVIDERRQRAQQQPVSVLCRRFGPGRARSID
jgi:hypothetical protein